MTLDHLPPAWRGYGRALLRVYDRLAPKWIEIERPRVNAHRRYGGCRDRVGVIFGRPAIVDFKTGAAMKWHGVQLAGYDLLDEGPAGARALFGIYLSEDGHFKIREHIDYLGDRATFVSKLSEYWKTARVRSRADL